MKNPSADFQPKKLFISYGYAAIFNVRERWRGGEREKKRLKSYCNEASEKLVDAVDFLFITYKMHVNKVLSEWNAYYQAILCVYVSV